MKFVFINDDPADVQHWLRWAKDNNYSAEAVESVVLANRISANFYVFDISAVAPINLSYTAYSPICTLSENHPGAVIVIVSGIAKDCREDIIEEVKSHKPDTFIIDGGYGTFKDFEKAIKDWM